MGIAILSGVVASLEPHRNKSDFPKWESHTPGTLTPVNTPDVTVPTRFIACVSKEQSGKKLTATFANLGRQVEIVVSNNLWAVQQADVILLWYAFRLRYRVPLFKGGG